MVEFDDGDRGKISLHNIRILPPGYQIHCECFIFLLTKKYRPAANIAYADISLSLCLVGGGSSPSLLLSSGTTTQRSSGLEQAPISDRNSVTNNQNLNVHKRRPGKQSHSWQNI